MTPEQRDRYYLEVINPRLQKFGARICYATGIDDAVLHEVAYQELVRFYDEQTAAGYWHPAFTEAIGDFTDDDAIAMLFYRRALEEARLLQEQTHSILVCMAERLFKLRQAEQAEACLREGRAEAVRRGDKQCVEQADRISREVSS